MNEATEEWYTLVVLKLHTGRTHQIRVHMLAIGHPLVCDVKYAENCFHADRIWCPRNFLHAYHLGFLDVPAICYMGQEAGYACVGEQADISNGTSLAKEVLDDAFSQTRFSSRQQHPVNIYSPLPEDLCASLSELVPMDEASGTQVTAWLSGEVQK